MKKSTLITTIAMIVVVVVALSTATYAWFSSNNTSIASTQITTTASADWIMVKGTVAIPDVANDYSAYSTTATFTSPASDSITLSNTMMGLYAPSAKVATTLSNAATTAISAIPTFYEAQIQGENTVETQLYDNKAVGQELKLPDVIRVTEAKNGTATLKLYVVVNIGTASDSTATKYAGEATSFYVAWSPVGGSSPAAGSATNGYNHKTAIAKNANFDGVATEVTGELSAVAASSLDRPTYDGNTGFVAATGTDLEGKLGVTSGEYYKTYEITIGEVGAGKSVYVLIYTWIDGWLAEANAAGANYKVTYAFVKA